MGTTNLQTATVDLDTKNAIRMQKKEEKERINCSRLLGDTFWKTIHKITPDYIVYFDK